jgi:hypothetical protein
VELEGSARFRRRGLTVAAIAHVFTISRVAQMLGEDEDWLFDIANEMEPEDGCLWSYGPGEETTLAFTDFGIENLTDLVQIHKADPSIMRRLRDAI